MHGKKPPQIEKENIMDDGSVARDQLKQIIERAERLGEEKKEILNEIKDHFAEAKSNGYDVPALREIIRLRAMETHDRQNRDALIDTYRTAVDL